MPGDALSNFQLKKNLNFLLPSITLYLQINDTIIALIVSRKIIETVNYPSVSIIIAIPINLHTI